VPLVTQPPHPNPTTIVAMTAATQAQNRMAFEGRYSSQRLEKDGFVVLCMAMASILSDRYSDCSRHRQKG
jgi:hypothetical protein